MYIETVPNRGARPTILLREGHREGCRVIKRTLANLTHWPADKVDLLRRVLRDEPLAPPEQTGRVLSSLPHGHVEAVLTVAHRIGLPEILGSRRSPSRDRALTLIVQRVLKPASKLATADLLGTSTLAEELGVSDTSEDELYATMDWLGKRQTWIEKNLAARHLHNGNHALYGLCINSSAKRKKDGSKRQVVRIGGWIGNVKMPGRDDAPRRGSFVTQF